jgi:photosystem II stability/assembly factor-like uncharacterized protein
MLPSARSCTWGAAKVAFCLLIAGCAGPGSAITPAPATASATLTQSIPSATPSETATPPAATATVTAAPAPAAPPFAHLAPRLEVTLSRIHMSNRQEGWAIGTAGDGMERVLRTADGGQTWADVSPPQPVPVDPQVGLQAAGYFPDASTAWVSYGSAAPPNLIDVWQVWRTTDGGQTWRASEPLDAQGIMDFAAPLFLGFSDIHDGWLMLDLGTSMMHQFVNFYTTQDGGQTWSLVFTPSGSGDVQSCDKLGVSFADSETGWLARDCHGLIEGAFIDVTTNGGLGWQVIQLPEPASDAFQPPNICHTDHPHLQTAQAGQLSVTCQRPLQAPGPQGEVMSPPVNYLYTTQDGGASWSVHIYPGGQLIWVNENTLLALSRRIAVSHDAGASWQTLKMVNWDGDFSFIDDQHGWAVARAAQATALVRTEDGGRTWQQLQPQSGP